MVARREISFGPTERLLHVRDTLDGAAARAWVADQRVRSGVGWAEKPPDGCTFSASSVLRRWKIHLGFRAALDGFRSTCTWTEPSCELEVRWP
ncbi:MAG: hypothetical protein EB084_15745 [Proteobacteria bacterium]|nr:hypothetical protein [Pseudomonadota bacterium]